MDPAAHPMFGKQQEVFMYSFEMRVQDAIFSGEVPMKQLAHKVNKRYSTLMRELSPWDDYAKLGLGTAVAIIRETKNRKLLKVIIEECGILPE